ncbi:MAG: PorV/PorQ family protein [candidate division Zixibacteria bacterium]|nr:PorV/PorQ family protein [candidate division Zixibacteria bacterium]
MKKLLFIYILLLMTLLASSVIAEKPTGGYAGSFLQIPIGARPSSMGGAYIGLANDGAGPFYNPAGISNLQMKMFATAYRTMQFDRKLGYMTLLFPAKNNSVIGINWLYAGSGAVAGRNQDGDLTGDDYSFNNHDIGIVFSKRFTPKYAMGAKFSYLQASLGDLTSFSVSFDFGFMIYVSQFIDREKRDLVAVQDIQIGLVFRNFAANYRWDTGDFGNSSIGIIQEDKVPLEGGLGVSARLLDRKLLLAVDAVYNEEQESRFLFGSEYFMTPEFALRAGFTEGSNLTFGTGYVFQLGNSAFAIDYAFSTQKEDINSEHIFSFDFLF